jgi:hypothetical protein
MVKSWECVFLQRWVNHPLSLSQAHAKAETMAFEKRKPSNMKVATAKKTAPHARQKRELKSMTLNTGSTVDGSVLARNGAVEGDANSCAPTPTSVPYALSNPTIS